MIGALIAQRRSRAAFDALNQRDIKGFLKNWTDDATFVYPGDVSASGSYSGKHAVRAWFQRWFEQFPSMHFTIKHVAVSNIFDVFGNNTVATLWDAAMANCDGLAGQNSGVTVITLRWGKAIRVQNYTFDTGERFRALWGE